MEIKTKHAKWINKAIIIVGVILLLGVVLYIDLFVRKAANKIFHPKEVLKWSQSSKDSLKAQLMTRRPDLQRINMRYRSAFCDCLIRKIDKAYPGGYYTTIDTAKINEMNEFCLDSITFRTILNKDTGKVFKDD